MESFQSIIHSLETEPGQTELHIPGSLAISVEGFEQFCDLESDILKNINSLSIAGAALSNLTSLVVANEECNWVDFVGTIHRMQNLQSLECTQGLSARGIFPLMLEDILLLITNLPNFRRLSIPMRVRFGTLDVSKLRVLLDGILNIEQFIVSDVQFTPFNNIQSKLALLLTELCNNRGLHELWIGQRFCSSAGPPLLKESTLQNMFRSSTLQRVTLRNMKLTDEDLCVVAEELSRNRALEHVDLRGVDRCKSIEGYRRILRTMETQYYVKSFKLHSPDILGASDEDESSITDDKLQISSIIESFAKLNGANRRHLIRDERSSREDIVNLLIVVIDDTNALLSTLLLFPQLFNSVYS